MPVTSWSDEHSRAVSEAKPDVGAPSQDQLDRTWRMIEARLPVDGQTSGRRRGRAAFGLGIAAVVLGAGGVATAAVLSAHTGRGPVDAEDQRLGGPGERLNPDAPDYGYVIAKATRDVPFPSEEARVAFVNAEVQSDQGGGGLVSTGAVRFWSARSAVCAWADEWVAADTTGDVPQKARAATMLEQASTWPAVTDLDPEQVITYKRIQLRDPSTGEVTVQRVADNTEAGYFPLIRNAVRAGDADTLGSVLARWGSCTAYGADMSDFPRAVAED